MIWWRTIRGRIALSIALAVLGSALVFAAASASAFYLNARAEAARRQRSPERQAAEDRENRLLLLRMGGGMALVLPFAFAGSAAVGLWLAARALAPMREAAARARRARAGSDELTLPLRGTGDEWDELAGVMNDLLREQQESISREKAFSANAAHELRTPLTAILGEVQVTLRRERTAPEYRAALEVLEVEVERLSSLVEALLTLARADSKQLGAASVTFDLADVARSAVDRARRRGHGLRGAVDVEVITVAVVGDPLLTGRILDNLIDNALRHAVTRVTVSVARRDGYGIAIVADDGPGLPPDVRARLFERFNKTASSGQGFGLGLAIAYAYVRAQGGTLALDVSAPLTSFVLGLPLDRDDERPTPVRRHDLVFRGTASDRSADA